MSRLTHNQKTALKSLLESVEQNHPEGWDYYKPSGWAGAQLYPLVEEEPKAKKMKPWIDEERVRGMFVLAGIEIQSIHQLENKYWPDHADYDDIRRASPWFLVQTKYGLIELGWRKRVMVINWEDTNMDADITVDQTTKTLRMVHAWSYPKAVEYLISLACAFAMKKD